MLFYESEPGTQKELYSANEQADPRHDRITEGRAKAYHYENYAQPGGGFEDTGVFFGEIEIYQGTHNTDEYDDCPDTFQWIQEAVWCDNRSLELLEQVRLEIRGDRYAGTPTDHEADWYPHQPTDLGNEACKIHKTEEQWYKVNEITSRKRIEQIRLQGIVPVQCDVITIGYSDKKMFGEFVKRIILVQERKYHYCQERRNPYPGVGCEIHFFTPLREKK